MALVKAWRCRHSGKYYPENYVKEWGKTTGIGLGPIPVSECLDTIYTNPPVACAGIGEAHPVGVTHAELDFVMVEEAEYEANKLILDKDDPGYARRMALIHEKQKKNPNNRLRGPVVPMGSVR